MKKLLQFLLVIAIISSCSKKSGTTSDPTQGLLPDTLSAGWTKISSLPTEDFNDIFFTDNSKGFAVSNNGIYKSEDGGAVWTKINPNGNMVNIGAGNSNNAAFLNRSPIVYATTDGGTTFSFPPYPNPGGGNPGFTDCYYTSADTCYFSSYEYIWKSFNAGISIDTVHRFPSTSSLSSLFFLNEREGWVMRLDGVYKTVDGGDFWDRDTALVSGFGSIDFIDSNTGYFSYYGTVNKTTDGGTTWLPVYESGIQSYADIDFVSSSEGYFSISNKIFKTTDAGATWTPVVALGNQFINEIYFTDASHGWAATSDGTVIKFVQ